MTKGVKNHGEEQGFGVLTLARILHSFSMRPIIRFLFSIQCQLLSFLLIYPFLPYSSYICWYLKWLVYISFYSTWKNTWCTKAGGNTLLVFANPRGQLINSAHLSAAREKKAQLLGGGMWGRTAHVVVAERYDRGFCFFLKPKGELHVSTVLPKQVTIQWGGLVQHQNRKWLESLSG